MTSNRYNSVGVLVALPLAILLWQGSSCRSSKANSNGNSSMNAECEHSQSVTRPARNVGRSEHRDEVSDEGATIEYDCAHGRINEKIAPDVNGKFEAKGIHKREHGGPERDDEVEGQPAIYRGWSRMKR